MANLTKNESDFLMALRAGNNPDEYNCSKTYIYFNINNICERHSLDPKKIRGIVTSLVKKLVIDEGEIEQGVQHFYYDFEEYCTNEKEKHFYVHYPNGVLDGCFIDYLTEEEFKDLYTGCCCGPFKTFTEAKEKALWNMRNDIELIRSEITRMKNTLKKDVVK